MSPDHTKTDHHGPVQALALDVDGTLLGPAGRISPANRAAIQRARAAGVVVLLASGRSPRALAHLLAELEIDGPAIAYSGALTFRRAPATGALHTLDATPMAWADAAAALAVADDHGVEVAWYAGDGWLAARRGPGVDEEAELTDEAPVLAPDLPRGAPPPYKLGCVVAEPARSPALRALRDALPPTTRGVLSHPRYLEVIAADVDKAHAVRATCARLGIPLAALAAIGDEDNDIGMLREAGIGIAMGNAGAAVRAAAARTTETNERDGVALAIAELLEGR